jgi:hypothetical protein
MDPYLEGYLWPDVHSAFSAKIRQLLTPLIRPRYTARLSIYLVEDTAPEGDVGILYPDVEIMRTRHAEDEHALRQSATLGTIAGVATPAALTIPVALPVDLQITTVEIRDTADNQLITSIELLSPVNKREPGLHQYRLKRQRLYQAGVHLLELDLLRRGTRPVSHGAIPDVPYLLTLTRAHSGKTCVWPLRLQDNWPNLPVPLRLPDDDVVLDLAAAFEAIYREAAYELSIDYRQPPPPPALSAEESNWMRLLLEQQEEPDQ